MQSTPLVLVTATTATVDGRSRVRLNEAYTDALVASGLIPVILPPVAPAVAVAALRGVAGLVLTGGEDVDPRRYGEAPHPATDAPHVARDDYEMALARAAAERRVPTLAICRGAQVVNVALGGTLVQDIAPGHPRSRERVHEVTLDAGSRLASVLGATRVHANSSHHQAIARPAPGVRVVGHAPDAIVEAVEAADRAWWMLGVQWHPEDLTATGEGWDRRLFAGFADEVRRAAAARAGSVVAAEQLARAGGSAAGE